MKSIVRVSFLSLMIFVSTLSLGSEAPVKTNKTSTAWDTTKTCLKYLGVMAVTATVTAASWERWRKPVILEVQKAGWSEAFQDSERSGRGKIVNALVNGYMTAFGELSSRGSAPASDEIIRGFEQDGAQAAMWGLVQRKKIAIRNNTIVLLDAATQNVVVKLGNNHVDTSELQVVRQ